MEKNSNVNESHKSFISHDSDYYRQKLIEHLKLTSIPARIAEKISQVFDFHQLELGECLNSRINSSEKTVHYEQFTEINQYFYVICQGRIRLLSVDVDKQREVSTQLLETGEIVGGECLLETSPLTYRAVVASEVVEVAKIDLNQLEPWLEKLPQLKAKWVQQAQTQQNLIFFKTLTQLRSLPSYQLRQLIPYFKLTPITAGKNLYQVNSADPGRWWLCQGQIQALNNSEQLPTIGGSWGYPQDTPQDWIAQTDLLVYQLSLANWETATAIAPELTKLYNSLTPVSSNHNHHKNGHQPSSKAKVPTVRRPLPKLSKSLSGDGAQAIPDQNLQQASVAIDFPKPLRLRSWLAKAIPFPYIEQQSSSDCGAACLAMVSLYWGKRFSLNTLRDLAGVGRSGASLKGLAKAAEGLGYHARPVRASFNRLMEEKNPWIAHWEGDHYIVVYRTKGNKVLVADPARGKRVLPRQEFLSGWTGFGLLLDPTERLHQTESEKRSLLKFTRVLLPYRNLGLQIILASIVIQVFSLINPLFTQIIIDQIVVTKSQETLNVFIVGAFICGTWGMGLTSVRKYLISYLSNRLSLTMVSGFINHTLRLPLKFFESRRVGDIITRVQENQKIQRFLIGQVLLSWLNFATGLIYLGLMLYYNWQLTLLVLALIPPILIMTLAATPLLRRISRERFNAAADQNSALVEMMNGVATVKAAAAEQELRWRWEERFTHQINVRFKGQKLGISLGLIHGLVNSLGGTALLWYGATLVINDHLSLGQYIAFNMMKGHVIKPVIALAGLWDELQEVLISVERLDDVFGTEPEETPDKQMMNLPTIQGDISFQDVTFRYESEEHRNTLQNISFEVKAGETVALVGRSGSGKTTLVKLLQGLYYPTNGQIYIDGHDVSHVAPTSLRSQLGVVPQECFLFSGTILENITLYQGHFSLEQAVEVAKLAEAHSFIQTLPLGYSTKVGERGTNLSGGQRQRIAIARALLGEPRVLVLDEATSSLDTESERRFQQNLTRLSRNRTTFIIAHRLSTVRNADRILVLDRGVLVEQGNHDKLIAQEGLYYHLAQQQISGL